MKLLMVSGDRSILQEKKGAFWYTLEELCKHWDRIDVICPFVCHELRGSTGLTMTHERTYFSNVHFHPCPRGLWYQPFWIKKKGEELIGEHHHDVMTVHDYPPFYNGIGAWWLHKKTGIPYALEIHHIVGYPAASSWQEFIGRWMSWMFLKWDAKHAQVVRCVNREIQGVFERWGLKNVYVVPSFYLDRDTLQRCRTSSFETPSPLCHGEPRHGELVEPRTITKGWTPQDDTELRTAPLQKQYDVVFCGRNVPNKGLKELREATKRIEASLLAIGSDIWLESKEEVYRAMQSGKIFVMNSKSEGGPRVLLEAMALGLPVISTRVGIAPEVITDGVNGFFTTGTVDDLFPKIRRLLDDEQLRDRIGKEARKIMNYFDRETLVNNYVDFLKSLV